MFKIRCVAALLIAGIPTSVSAQTTPLLPTPLFHAIRDASSGELPLVDFRHIETHYSGFAPSKGGDEIAEYIAGRMRQLGLSDVTIEGYPADGTTFFWAFRTEPAWEAEAGVLEMVQPRLERLADFAAYRIVLGRFSSSANVTADLVDVGEGVRAEDYAGKDVKGKLVLATGAAGRVHAEAVWGHGAAGVVWVRTAEALERPRLLSNPGIVPWRGPRGEAPGFAFGLSYEAGMELRQLLRHGERIQLRAVVKATTGTGEYKQVSAVIPGTDASLKEVWIKAHDNYRNTGGGNNLTGVGATIEMARVLQQLIAAGELPRPRRTIRFLWSAEHYGSTYQFYAHPERLGRVLVLLNVDMVGYHQEKAKAVARLYRLPHSLPHFLSDVTEEFMCQVGRANSISIRNRGMETPGFYDAVFAPTGSSDQMHYAVEDFWGPSDHEDVLDGSLRVPAVLYNDWPDVVLGTQEDNLDKFDPTQARRAVLTVAATAYYLASVTSGGISELAHLIVTNAQTRLANETSRAYRVVADADAGSSAGMALAYREARNILAQARSREMATVDSLLQLDDNPTTASMVARSRQHLDALYAADDVQFHDLISALTSERKLRLQEPALTTAEQQLTTVVPRRNDAIRGPVNVNRPEYGAMWLAQKTGDPDFRAKLRLAGKGQYVPYETLNFVDGKRTLWDIRNAVSAEFGPVEASDIDQYFRFLEGVGVVSLGAAPGRTR